MCDNELNELEKEVFKVLVDDCKVIEKRTEATLSKISKAEAKAKAKENMKEFFFGSNAFVNISVGIVMPLAIVAGFVACAVAPTPKEWLKDKAPHTVCKTIQQAENNKCSIMDEIQDNP